MYKFARLRALLWSLSVTPASRSKALMRWALKVLGPAVSICFALALVFKTSHDWPITWHDIAARDEVARSFLLSSFVWLMYGLYFVTALSFGSRGASARLLPPPAIGPALRNALRDRDSRVGKVEQIEPPMQESAAEGVTVPPISTLTVPAPELLTRPLALAFAVFAAGMLALAFASFFLWMGLSMLNAPSDMADGGIGAEFIYTSLRFVGIFAPLALWALVSAWRFWIRWLAKVWGAEVAIIAEGLTIRDQATLWRRRFIAWRDVTSLARFTYNDSYVRPRSVYLLDAGDQTFLWESPPDMRYATPARRARIAEQQASAAQLLARVSEATGLPLLNISGVVSSVAKIDPDPYSTRDEPDPRDTALLDFIEGVTSGHSVDVASPRPQQFRRGASAS